MYKLFTQKNLPEDSRKKTIYPIFFAEIVAACLYLFAVCEEKNAFLVPREILSAEGLKTLSLVFYIVALTLTAILSVFLLKKRTFDKIAKIYVATLAVGVVVNIAILLPIEFFSRHFVPQVLPVTLLILSQCMMMIETYDEQRLAVQNENLKILSEKRREMMATISHETRTPLAVISMYAGLIAAEMRAEGVSEQRAKDLDNIIEQIQNINEIMKQYSSLSETSDRLTPVSLVDVANRTVQVYKHILKDAGITLKTSFSDDLPYVIVHPGKLTQVFLNIMKNAASHSGATEMYIKAAESEHGFLSVTITDNGRGFPPDILPNVFKRGVSSCKNSNCTDCAGIGLAVCKSIIEAAGGEISVRNESGAAVTFTLPIFSENINEIESLTY
jgi:signal transduction histidine kinase